MQLNPAPSPRAQAVLAALGGAEPTSLIDYPGHLAMVLFLQGCNLDCPWCHNRNLIPLPRQLAKADQKLVVQGHIKSISRWAGLCDAVVISGGEPCIHPGLGELISWLKSLGLKVKLDSNGFLPKVLADLLADPATRPDFLAMDIKAAPLDTQARLDRGWYKTITNSDLDLEDFILSLRRVQLEALEGHLGVQFRTTHLPWHKPDELERIRAFLGPEWPLVVQDYRPRTPN
jgi:pyruvate formate lyase activating enzyme